MLRRSQSPKPRTEDREPRTKTNPAVCRPPGLSFLERGLHTVQPRQGHGLNVQPPGTVTQFRHWITSLENRVSPAAASVTTRRRALFPLGVPRGSSPAPVSKRSREAGSRAGRSSWFAAAARRGVLPRFGDRSPRGTGSRLQRDASGLPNPIIARRCGSSNTKSPRTRTRCGTGRPWTYSLPHQGPIRRRHEGPEGLSAFGSRLSVRSRERTADRFRPTADS